MSLCGDLHSRLEGRHEIAGDRFGEVSHFGCYVAFVGAPSGRGSIGFQNIEAPQKMHSLARGANETDLIFRERLRGLLIRSGPTGEAPARIST